MKRELPVQVTDSLLHLTPRESQAALDVAVGAGADVWVCVTQLNSVNIHFPSSAFRSLSIRNKW